MDSFELNKIAGAVLFTLLVYIGIQNLGDILFSVDEPNPNAFIVEGVIEEGATAETAVAEAAETPISELLLTASAEKGANVVKKCAACHNFVKDAPHKIGPNLYAVVNRDIASAGGFGYSAALSGLEGNWNAEALNGFLKNPKSYAAGTSMAFAGLRKETDRADVIAYLSSLKD